MLKKILALSFLISTIAFVAPSVEASSAPATVTADPQIRVRIGPQQRNNRRYNRRYDQRYNRRVQVRTYTRIVRYGRTNYRETIRVTYLPNGRTRTQVISRTRVGRNY